MSEAKHTPGPWTVGPQHRENQGKSWLFFSYQTHILAPDGLVDLAIVESSEEEGEANARLIAFAPDMLAALQLVRDMLESGRDGAKYDALRVLRNAIADATGE